MKPIRSVFLSMLAVASVSGPALAALGDDAASVESDRVHFKGTLHVTPGVTYSVHEIQLPSGTLIHEYSSAAGKVFAGIPDLHQLLGACSTQLAAAANQPHYNHRQLSVQTPDVVVESSGRLRSFFGRAWVPTLLPPNFSLGDLN